MSEKTTGSGKTQLWKITLWKVWYAVNIPIIVFLDSNAVLPQRLQYTKGLLDGYINSYHDFLCANPPNWLKQMTIVEILFQLPVAVYCLYQLLNLSSSRGVKKTLARVGFLSKCYALNAVTTTSFCIWYVWAYGYYPGTESAGHVLMSNPDKFALTMVYAPYVVIPSLFFI
ncbi:unnamed protein product [Kluyveromyces dobzhanskii CBS 2104]|uniref:Efficient mitochondria targeting-associated protein 19 n=1 Tax=Kluyveromyces dobzhanskii CBS 2104 TaxID=1427455 RepID=A0A0A8L3J0_9SACH|nr:unnamed protein product [Kluyveromyces dobzhanskii CBS 2104]